MARLSPKERVPTDRLDPLERAPVGRTGLAVTRLGLGTAALGFLYAPVDEETALGTVRRALSEGLNFLDTAPLYGRGLAEARVGRALRGVDRASYVLATKVGYVVPEEPPADPAALAGLGDPPHDYSYDSILRGVEASLKRLGVDRIDILHIHDPDYHYDEAMQGAYRALEKLRDEGVIRAIGAGMNQWQMLARFAREGRFDCFLLAGRYTLLDQSALPELLPVCEEKGIAVFVGGPFNSGILADPYSENATFNYVKAPPEWVAKARRIDDVCRRHGVPLKAAAIQFPALHPAVAAVLTGARSPAELEENLTLFRHPIPADLWADLKAEGLLDPAAPTGA